MVDCEGGDGLQLPGDATEVALLDILSVFLPEFLNVLRGLRILLGQFWDVQELIALKHCAPLQFSQLSVVRSMLGKGFFLGRKN